MHQIITKLTFFKGCAKIISKIWWLHSVAELWKKSWAGQAEASTQKIQILKHMRLQATRHQGIKASVSSKWTLLHVRHISVRHNYSKTKWGIKAWRYILQISFPIFSLSKIFNDIFVYVILFLKLRAAAWRWAALLRLRWFLLIPLRRFL